MDIPTTESGLLRSLDRALACTLRRRGRRERCRQGARRAHAPRQPTAVPRNHRVEEALAAASDAGDLAPFERLLGALSRPYDEDPALARYAEPAPGEFMAKFRTFCGT